MKNQLLNLRTNKGSTQKQVADYIGCSYQCYQKYENGTREADYNALSKLAEFFNTSVDYLLGRTELNAPPLQWTDEEKAAGVGAHGTNLSKEEWDWLELRSAIIEGKGEKGLRAIQIIIQTFLDEK